jgi:hypothetical protein
MLTFRNSEILTGQTPPRFFRGTEVLFSNPDRIFGDTPTQPQTFHPDLCDHLAGAVYEDGEAVGEDVVRTVLACLGTYRTYRAYRQNPWHRYPEPKRA